MPLLWLVDESDLGNLAGNEHLLDEFLTVPYPTAELGPGSRLLRHRSAGELDDAGPPWAARPEPAHVPGPPRTAARST